MSHARSATVAAGLAALLASGAAPAATVTVTLHKVTGAQGEVVAALCDKNTFLKRCALVQRQPANPGDTTLRFTNVEAGRYALSAYHDANGNKKMDRNFIGMPAEGYGFSRDAPIRMGPPSFEDAAIDVKDGDNDIALTLRY